MPKVVLRNPKNIILKKLASYTKIWLFKELMTRKKILITGALGHIGAHLIRHLTEGQYSEVVLLDNLESRRFPSLYHLPQKKYRYRFLQDDILTANFDKILNKYGITTVIHLAAITDAEGSHKIPKV